MPTGVEDTVAVDVDVEAEDLTTRAHRINQISKGKSGGLHLQRRSWKSGRSLHENYKRTGRICWTQLQGFP